MGSWRNRAHYIARYAQHSARFLARNASSRIAWQGFVLDIWQTFALLLAGVGLLCISLLGTPSSFAWAAGATGEAVAESGPASSSGMRDSLSDNSVNARQTADNSFLYDMSIFELANADTSMQGNTVQIVGEVVGDSIRAEEDPGKCWITLEAIEEEYENSISVLVDEDILGLIDTYGGYNRKGTTLQVRGTFYLACPSHEGILDIHAEHVTLVARGSTTSDEFHLHDFRWGFTFTGIGVVLLLVYRYLRERER